MIVVNDVIVFCSVMWIFVINLIVVILVVVEIGRLNINIVIGEFGGRELFVIVLENV